MNKEKQKALEAAGWVFEDAEDFLELTAEERAIVEMRVQLSRAIRALREKQKLTQAQLAKKMKTSQPRVNKIEAGSPGVSLEQLLNSWFALGGTAEMKLRTPPTPAVRAIRLLASAVDCGPRSPRRWSPRRELPGRSRGSVIQERDPLTGRMSIPGLFLRD